MTDTTTAAQAARLAAEHEAAHEIAAQTAPDDPNPGVRDQMSDVGGQRSEGTDLTSDIRPPTSDEKPLERITAADRSRADIAARFKEKRAAHGGQVEFHGDMRDPSQIYGPLGLQTAEDGGQTTDAAGSPAQQELTGEEAQTVQQPPPSSDLRPLSSEPKLVKVKVHGREMLLPENEVIAEAQKSLAAGNLLESAKEVLAGVRPQRTDVRDRMSEETDPASDIRHPASDPFVALAQTLQMESADSAATKLKQAIESETAKARQEAAREAARHVRIETEVAVSQRALQAFERAHPDLASDEFARDAITTQVQREINADLQAAVTQGILKELPKAQDERNGLHTQLRAFGAPVRSIGDIFAEAGSKYATWRGDDAPAPHKSEAGNQKPGNPTFTVSTSAQPAPRVELSPGRAQRRATIPNQPTNGTVPPRPAPPPEQTTAQRRSAAVMAMRKARGQIVA
jgi:hypothetical protein